MPDESCRSCGGDLMAHSQCEGCRKAVQKVCQACNTMTRRQFHAECHRRAQVGTTAAKRPNQCMLETVKRAEFHKSYGIRPISVFFGTAAFLILYITFATHPGLLQGHSTNTEMVNSESLPSPQARYGTVTNDQMQNCLAYGSGESVTVTCPTEYGYVYKAILNMPKDLAARFSDAVFSIRGISVAENSDGTVVLQYENAKYVTSFFGI